MACEWRRPEKRQAIVRKIAEAVRMFPEVLTRNPGDVEATIYNKAKSEHEYMNMVDKIVLSIKHRGMGLMQQHPPQQPGGWQQPGGEMIQRPQVMIEWDHMNPGLTGGVPQPDPTGYPRFQPGMHPMQQHYGQHSGMGMPRIINQPTPQPAMYNMPQSGGPMMQRHHPHMGSHPGMVRPPMNPPPFMTRGMSPGPMPPMRPIMNMTSMQGSGKQVVTALPNPYTTGVDPVHQPPSHPSGAPSPFSGSASSSVYQPSHPTASSGAPPPQPHPPQTNSPKPRPPQAPSPRQPIPSPNTPWNPNSPSINTSPGQPSGQPAITPEPNTAVLLKLQELQPYIPLLAGMIDKLNRAKGSSDEKSRSDQLSKLNSLYNVLQSKNMKVPLQTLEKCHQALKKLFVEKETVFSHVLTRSLQEGYVLLTILKIILIGPPGVGKTSFKSLLFNWLPVLQHHSTGIASRPVQAIERMIGQNDGKIWENVTAERLLSILAGAMNALETITPAVSDPVTGSHSDYLVEHPTSSNLPQTTSRISVQKVSSELQPDPSFYSTKILEHIGKRKVSEELYQSTWIYFLDSGGQPHFADVSRAFIRSNTIYTIAIKLTDRLSDRPAFCYSLKGKLLTNPSELCMSNLQLIKHFVCSIVSSKSDAASKSSKSLIFIIGTCSDLYYSNVSKMESIKEKDDRLISELGEFREHLIFHNELSHELIHPVNNLCEGEDREELSSNLRASIMSRIKKGEMEVQIPIRWFVFEIMMKDQVSGEGIITLEICYDVGRKLGIEKHEVTECLKYFDSLSLVLYFPKILPNIIFSNFQYLLDMLSNLISISFVNYSLTPGAQIKLRDEGIFEESLLDELPTLKFVPLLFTKTEFLKLLKYLCIVAPISSTLYFIPVVLSMKEKKKEKLKNDNIEPMIIKFQNGVVPQGVFLAVVVGLLNRENYPKFSVDLKAEQMRHAVELFSHDLSAPLVLIEEFQWIELHFFGDREKCHDLKEAISETILSCANLLAYDSIILTFVISVPCQLLHEEGPYPFHPAIINEESLIINCPHEKRLRSRLSPNQQCWFNKNTDSVIFEQMFGISDLTLPHPIDPLNIFQTYFADLCDAIEADPLRIVNRLISHRLVRPSIRNDITTMSGTAYEKASKIAQSIENYLEGSNEQVQFLQNLCDFLQNNVEDRTLNDIGANMRKLL